MNVRLNVRNHIVNCTLFLTVALLLGAVALIRSTTNAAAWHYGPGPLMWSTSTTSYGEQFCVQVDGGSVTDAELNSYLKAALYQDNPNRDWDNLAGGRIYWSPLGDSPCWQQADQSQIEMAYYSSANGCDGYSCAWFSGDSGWTWNGHRYYWYGRVLFKAAHLESASPCGTSCLALRRHVINHETGHTLGLADPDLPNLGQFPPYPNSSATLCGSYYRSTGTGQNVMHSNYYSGYGDPVWPDTDGDIWCVERLAYQQDADCWYP